MSDPQRLIKSGNDDDRRLLQSAQEIRVPDHVKEEVRRAVDRRRHESPRRRRAALVLGLAGACAATAVAAHVLGLMDEPPTKDSQPESVPYGGPGTPPPKTAAIPSHKTPPWTATPSSPAKMGRPTRATEGAASPSSAVKKRP